jgi:hypothetical protein
MTWRNSTILLGIVCAWFVWRDCTRRAPAPKPPTVEECERVVATAEPAPAIPQLRAPTAQPDHPQPEGGLTYAGFHVPAWAVRLAPQPGENLLAYRDRMLPIVKAAVAPHRARVARGRDDFAKLAGLDDRQKAELDAAVQDAATQIQDKLLNAVLSGELSPQQFKPMTGVALARDVLDVVDGANKRFLASLRDDQRSKLAQHPFDVADYLVFATRWEDALGL